MNRHTRALLGTVVPSSCERNGMMKIWLGVLTVFALVGMGAIAEAQCIVDTSTPTYANGQFLRYTPCDVNGQLKTSGSGGSGGSGTDSAVFAIATAVTTNTTTTPVLSKSGTKTIQGVLTGTGAISVIAKVYGNNNNNTTDGVLFCTLSLSGTTRVPAMCDPVTANPKYLYATTESISGTSAEVTINAGY